MRFEVAKVPADLTWELRRTVLRPHETVAQLALADDDEATTGTFAALDEEGVVVGSARVALEAAPFHRDGIEGNQWRLRGMATREDLRHQGIGAAVLSRAIDHVAEHGGGLLWCNARVPAMSLYRRAGFVGHGDPWDDPDIGPHVVMWRIVSLDRVASSLTPSESWSKRSTDEES